MDIDEQRCFVVDLLFWIDEVEFISLLSSVPPVLDIEFTFQTHRRQQCF